jgi:hypothetical protein
VQALCFFAVANSIFFGDKLLTAGNPAVDFDRKSLVDLGITAQMPRSLEGWFFVESQAELVYLLAPSREGHWVIAPFRLKRST